jgi:hypothetical protein
LTGDLVFLFSDVELFLEDFLDEAGDGPSGEENLGVSFSVSGERYRANGLDEKFAELESESVSTNNCFRKLQERVGDLVSTTFQDES